MMATRTTDEMKGGTMQKDISELKFADITSVYSGKAHHCCCGCAGKHYRPNVDIGKPIPGLEFQGTKYDKDDCSDRMIRKVLGILQASPSKVEDGGNCYAITIGKRIYIAYTDD